jgi:hypothetical protein
VGKLPIQIKGKANSSNTQLPTFKNDKEVNVFIQAFLDLIHHIRLSTQQSTHLFQALFFCLNLEFRTKLVKLLQVKVHLSFQLATTRQQSDFAHAINSFTCSGGYLLFHSLYQLYLLSCLSVQDKTLLISSRKRNTALP